MASFNPSKKTAQDFNNNTKYIDYDASTGENGDSVQADTVNNLIESALYTQERADNAETASQAAQVSAENAANSALDAQGSARTATEQAQSASSSASSANTAAREAATSASNAEDFASEARDDAEFVKALATNDPDISEVSSDVEPSVSIIDKESSPRLKFSGLKGEKGDKGETGARMFFIAAYGEHFQYQEGMRAGDYFVVTEDAPYFGYNKGDVYKITNATPDVPISFEKTKLNIIGPQGDQGEVGPTPSIDITTKTYSNVLPSPRVSVEKGGTDLNPKYTFSFDGLKGETGLTPVYSIDYRFYPPQESRYDGVSSVYTLDGYLQVASAGFEELVVPCIPAHTEPHREAWLVFPAQDGKLYIGRVIETSQHTADNGVVFINSVTVEAIHPFMAIPIVDASATVDGSTENPSVMVENKGTLENPRFVFKFTGLKGYKGETGETPDITVTAESVEPDVAPSVEKSGSIRKPEFKFKIPKGKKGDTPLYFLDYALTKIEFDENSWEGNGLEINIPGKRLASGSADGIDHIISTVPSFPRSEPFPVNYLIFSVLAENDSGKHSPPQWSEAEKFYYGEVGGGEESEILLGKWKSLHVYGVEELPFRPDIQISATTDGTSLPVPTVSVEKGGSLIAPTYSFEFHGLKGGQGERGTTPKITADVKTGEAGTVASVEKSGTDENPTFTFTIPRGDKGETGETPDIQPLKLIVNGQSYSYDGSKELTISINTGSSSGLRNEIY